MSSKISKMVFMGANPIDGLCQVTTRYLCAGFAVERGIITACAPTLRKKIAYWKTVAVRIGADPKRSLRYTNPHLGGMTDGALSKAIAKSVKSSSAVEGIRS